MGYPATLCHQILQTPAFSRTEGTDLWEACVTGARATHWKLQPVGESALLLQRDDFKGRAEQMRQSSEWQTVVSQPVDPGQTLLIKAAPGSGKSTLLREWCRGRPNNNILVTASNKAICEQLKANFQSELKNVTVKKIHSVAYDATRHLHRGNVGDPTKTDIKNFLKCRWDEVERRLELLKIFCASASPSLDCQNRRELQLHKSLWESFASGSGHFRVPHNVYLKLLQLNSELQDQAFQDFSIVVVDETQDW